jgi:hypothetical protein
VAFTEVKVVIDRRCISCHSRTPTDDVFRIAANGVTFDAPENLRTHAEMIRTRVVLLRNMPLANKTGMTDESGSCSAAGSRRARRSTARRPPVGAMAPSLATLNGLGRDEFRRVLGGCLRALAVGARARVRSAPVRQRGRSPRGDDAGRAAGLPRGAAALIRAIPISPAARARAGAMSASSVAEQSAPASIG